jgi:hypothetical protein
MSLTTLSVIIQEHFIQNKLVCLYSTLKYHNDILLHSFLISLGFNSEATYLSSCYEFYIKINLCPCVSSSTVRPPFCYL